MCTDEIGFKDHGAGQLTGSQPLTMGGGGRDECILLGAGRLMAGHPWKQTTLGGMQIWTLGVTDNLAVVYIVNVTTGTQFVEDNKLY